MDSAKLNDWMQVIGIFAIILSLMFVAYQIQQTNQIAIVSTEIEIRNNYAELNETMYSDRELSVLIEKAADPNYQPLPGEYTQLRSLAFRFMNIWLASEIAYKNDMLPEVSFHIVLDDIGFLLQTMPYLKQLFRELLDNYPSWENTEVAETIKIHLTTRGDA